MSTSISSGDLLLLFYDIIIRRLNGLTYVIERKCVNQQVDAVLLLKTRQTNLTGINTLLLQLYIQN